MVYYKKAKAVADMGKSNHCLEMAGVKDSTEVLIMSAQEHALECKINRIWGLPYKRDPGSRLCKYATETMQHMLAARAFKQCYNHRGWH